MKQTSNSTTNIIMAEEKIFSIENPIITKEDRAYVLERQKKFLADLKFNQENRGPEKLLERRKIRAASGTSWRQMSAMKLIMNEAKHPGNYPFVIGFGVMGVVAWKIYSLGYTEENMKKSFYWQRCLEQNGLEQVGINVKKKE